MLRFGQFELKSGRISPYFFNAGLFNDGAKLSRLAWFYAQRILLAREQGLQADVVFGPAYKGIPLGATVAAELARQGWNLGFTFNRKEAKAHGEGGSLVGAPLQGRVIVVDDVVSAGTATRESVAIIRAAGAQASALVIGLDRQEKATEVTADGVQDMPYSAVQHVQKQFGLEVFAIARLGDLLQYLQSSGANNEHSERVAAYRTRYGV